MLRLSLRYQLMSQKEKGAAQMVVLLSGAPGRGPAAKKMLLVVFAQVPTFLCNCRGEGHG